MTGLLMTPVFRGSLATPTFRGTAPAADGLGFHIPRGYLCFAIAFSLGVELLNSQARKRAEANGKVH